jgi:putative adhesin
MTSRVHWLVLLFPLAALAAACDLAAGGLTGQATDEWTRTYPLTAGAELHVGNTNGLVEIEGVDGSTLDVRAERLVRATTDSAARSLLQRIVITEQVTPHRVSLDTERTSGLMIGAAFEVRYHVRAPKAAALQVDTTNGRIIVTGLAGPVVAGTTNGDVVASDLSGGIRARATNGAVVVGLASVGLDPIELHTTNGAVALTLPEDAKADLAASVTNGAINVSGVKLDAPGQSRRRVVGRINGGGTLIELSTTNGAIQVRAEGADQKPGPKTPERR